MTETETDETPRASEKELLRQFAIDHFAIELKEAEKLFRIKQPESFEPQYLKQITFIDNAKKAKLMTLKGLAQMISGDTAPEAETNPEDRAHMKMIMDKVQNVLQVKADLKKGGRRAAPIDMRPYNDNEE